MDKENKPVTHFSKMCQAEIDEYISANVEKRIEKFSQDDLLKQGSEIKIKKKKNFIILFSLSCVFLCLAIVFFILGSFILDNFLTLGVILILVFIVLFAFSSTKIKFLKATEENCVRFEIEKSIKEQIKEFINIEKEYEKNNYIDGKEIKSTKIIDSHMEYSDKLHGFLNYQEVIQHHVCKFLVTFTDNSTKVYDAEEGSSLYRKLIMFINNPAENQKANAPISSADELAKFKKLLDEGVITQEEFDKKKKDLL